MPYNWSQLAFVERWRPHGVRGHLVGMHRPEDRTYFDLRLRAGEGNVKPALGPVDLHLQDRGDIIREKRMVLLAHVSAIVRLSASMADGRDPTSRGRSRRWLDPGCYFSATVVEVDGTTALLDAGLPLVAEFQDASAVPNVGTVATFRVEDTPMGFLVV